MPKRVGWLAGFTAEQKILGGALVLYLLTIGLVKTSELWTGWLKSLLGNLISWRPRRKAAGIRIGFEKITDEERKRHTHIVGATGSGKTVLIEHLLFADLKRGYGALVIDPKGDREFYDRVKAYCRRIGRGGDLHLLSATYSNESVIWNPCGVGGISELQTKFYNSAIYSEPHYAKACEGGLLQAFTELPERCPDGFTVSDLVAELKEIAKATKDKNLEGLFLDLYNLSHGEWAEVLACRPAPKGKKEISLLDITQQNQILFVHLPTESKAVQSARIGRLLTQEIMTISGIRKLYPETRGDRPFSVFIDEFDAFATESITSFINKGRSSDFMIHMAHQTLSDLNRISPHFTGQIMGNCNVRFVFRQDDPDDAERWSRVFGTRTVVKRTYQTEGGIKTGASSNRDAQEFKVAPDAIKELKTGRCIFYVKTSRRLIKMRVPKPLRLAPYPSHIQCTPPETRGRGMGLTSLYEEAGGAVSPSPGFETLVSDPESPQ